MASRRHSEELIAAGRVTVNRARVTDFATQIGEGDRVQVDGIEVNLVVKTVTYLLNKPIGVISSASDQFGRQTVTDLVDSDRRLYPVGRLDLETSGLILLTDNGELANRLTHPRYRVPKTYRAIVGGGRLENEDLAALRQGVKLEDGITAPAEVKRCNDGSIEITIREGRNHQVRRMCAAVGHPVKQLQRVQLGDLRLGSLRVGSFRKLTEQELLGLRKLVGL